MKKLEIYDLLRQAHKTVFDIDSSGLSNEEQNAIDAVSGVLYLAESVFAKED